MEWELGTEGLGLEMYRRTRYLRLKCQTIWWARGLWGCLAASPLSAIRMRSAWSAPPRLSHDEAR